MIRDAGSKYDEYSISPKIRQILLHWGYELTEKDFFIDLTNWCIKMSYYWFNRQEILQKAKERYSKEKATEYYLLNKESIKEKSKNWYKNLSKEEKDKTKEYQRKIYQQLIQYKKEALQSKWLLSLLSIKMSEKTLKFDNIRVDKKVFDKSKQPIDLGLINVDEIVVSDKFMHSDNVLNILLVKKEKLLNRYALFCLKWMDT